MNLSVLLHIISSQHQPHSHCGGWALGGTSGAGTPLGAQRLHALCYSLALMGNYLDKIEWLVCVLR